uniref:Cysteine protease n=1 Tax=Caenorhabditis japonica TaxID=281687 RepID=A0A8R1I5Y9_CAEJA
MGEEKNCVETTWTELAEFAKTRAIQCSAFVLFVLFGLFCILNAFGALGTNALKIRAAHYKQIALDYCQFTDQLNFQGTEATTEHPNATLISLLAVVRQGERYGIISNKTDCQVLNEQEQKLWEEYLNAMTTESVTGLDFEKVPKNDECRPGSLTPRGAIRAFSLGRYLYGKYKDSRLFDTFHTDLNIHLTSFKSLDSVASGVALISGLLDQNETKFAKPIDFKVAKLRNGCTDEECDCTENYERIYELARKLNVGVDRQYRVLSAYPILRYLKMMAEKDEKEVVFFSADDSVMAAILRVLVRSLKFTDLQINAARIVFESLCIKMGEVPRSVDYSSDSTISDDEREHGEQMEHVLKYGAPEDATTPESERIVVYGKELLKSAPTSTLPNESGNPSWYNRIKTAGASMMESIRPSSSSQDVRCHSENGDATGFEKNSKKKWKAKLWSTWNNIKYSSKWMSDRSDEYGGEHAVVFLGRIYPMSKDESGMSMGFQNFCSDYYSKIWITYRTDFPPLLDSDTTTDCGWGCMIRTTQMMTAHAIMLNRFGREWRFVRRKRSHVAIGNTDIVEFDRDKLQELMILKLFEDKETAPLGIHKMVEIASRGEKGKMAVGSWYSPSEAVFIMKKALSLSVSPLTGDTAMLLSIDGHVHIRDIEIETKNWMKTLILVVVVRLGAAELNPIYLPHLKFLFSKESCLGVTGGRPDHSSWFVGYYGDQVIYLDPHVAHEYIPIDVNFSEQVMHNKKPKKCPERSYHCRLLSKMPFLSMDPSCALCFRFESKEEFDKDMRELNLHQFIDIDQGEEHGMKRVRDPLFSVVYGERRRAPSYNEPEVTDAERAQADRHGFEML